MTPTLPKSQGLEASRALFKKRQKPKSKKPPTETKVTPPKPTKGYGKSHSVSSSIVPDSQDLKRNIQLDSTGFPSTLNEGTHNLQHLLESTATHLKDSGGNIQPFNRDLTSMTFDEGTAKTTPRPKGPLGDKDLEGNKPLADTELIHPILADPLESEEDILGGGKEMDEEPQAASIGETYHQSPPPQADKPQSSHAPSTEASDTDSSCDDRSLRITGKSMQRPRDLYKGFNIITELLKEIKNAVKDDHVINKKINKATESFTKISTNITEAHALKQDEELAAWAKSSTNMAWNLGSRILGLERAQNHIQSSISFLKENDDMPSSPARRVILPKKSETIYDTLLRFVGLYTHHFSLSNLRLPIPLFICDVLNYFKAYGGEPSVDLIRSFLNLGCAELLLEDNKLDKKYFKDKIPMQPQTDPLYAQISTYPCVVLDPILYLAGLKTSWEYSPKRLVIYHRGHGRFEDNQGSFSVKSVNNKTPILDADPISVVLPANVVDNIIDSNSTSSDDELPPVHPPISSFPEARRAPVQVSKVNGDASTPLNVNSHPVIHEFPSAKELKDATNYHSVVPHITHPSWKQHLRDISIEQLCDMHDRAYMCQAILNNMLNSRTSELISALHKARASCDAIREREEIHRLRQDRAVVVSKVVPDAAMKLVHSDEMGVLVARIVRAVVVHGRWGCDPPYFSPMKVLIRTFKKVNVSSGDIGRLMYGLLSPL
nr:hypothetical protein [Tanacetum cinerariifolium]